MTNLEWIAKNGRNLFDFNFCEYAHVAKYGKYCPFDCEDCKFNSDVEVVKALMEEHEEKDQETKHMTNSDWIAESIDDLHDRCLCQCAHVAKYGYLCGFKVCGDCEFGYAAEVIKALMEEHEEKKR